VEDNEARAAERAGAGDEVEAGGLVEGAAVGPDGAEIMGYDYLPVTGSKPPAKINNPPAGAPPLNKRRRRYLSASLLVHALAHMY